ncbi:uncharacterized protein LOC136025476 [Artemia franciscana]|uniref:uncharacterized protein LOC136025476 n=1 Tax=Artemia franciscana TaxID=6661 RepID=UPI0032DBE1D6
MKKRNQETLSIYKAVWNRVADSVKKLKSAYEEKLASEIKLNPKSFWIHVSSKNPNHHTIPDLVDHSVLHSSLIDKADILNAQFASAFTQNSCTSSPDPPSYEVFFPMPDLSVSEVMVFNSLGKLDVNKSKGPDGVHPRLLKECRKAFSYPLCMLLQLSLQNGELPHDWKTSYITPIHKKG